MTDPAFVMYVGGMATGKSASLAETWDLFEGVCPRLALTAASQPEISTRAGQRQIPATRVRTWADVVDAATALYRASGPCLVLIDEVQFLAPAEDRRGPLLRVHALVRAGCTVVAAGLMVSTEFEPFMPTAEALGYATLIVHHRGARCATCGQPTAHALCTVAKDAPVLEGQGMYEPRCLAHLADDPNVPQELRDYARIAD